MWLLPRRAPRSARPSFLPLFFSAILIASAALPTLAAAPETAGSPLTVPQASICTDVKERQAVGAATQFPTSVGSLYCLTKIEGAAEKTHVTHVWFHGDSEVLKVELQVGGPGWRTWSHKTIPPGWTGSWRVDVQDANGVVIYSIPFTISDQAGEAKPEATPAPSPAREEPH